MPKGRSPARDEALKMWLDANPDTIKVKDIADKLGVSENLIRKWKSADKWDEKRTEQRTNRNGNKRTEKRTEKKKPKQGYVGAPKGNRNAAGNCDGAPLGNQYAVKHGAYSKIMAGLMPEEEFALYGSMQEESELDELVRNYEAACMQEVRLMKRIADLRSKDDTDKGMLITSFSQTRAVEEYGIFADKSERTIDTKGQKPTQFITSGSFTDDAVKETTKTETGRILDYIIKLESELSKTQSRKARLLSQINSIKFEREKFEYEKSKNSNSDEGDKDLVAAWVEAVNGTSGADT